MRIYYIAYVVNLQGRCSQTYSGPGFLDESPVDEFVAVVRQW